MEKNEAKFTKGPWRVNKVHVKNVLQDGEHEECWVETFGFDDIAKVVLVESRKAECIANAGLISVAPELYEFAHFFETFAGQAYLKILPDEAGQKIYTEAVKLCKLARGEKDEMTQEQIKACREYLSVIEMIKEANSLDPYDSESPRLGVMMTGAFEERRRDAHYKLLDTYGFKYESDTWDVTSDIPDGMTPRELHDKLMDLKRKQEADRDKDKC